MMNYELFKEMAIKKLSDYTATSCPGYKLEIHSVFKVNQKLDGVFLMPEKSKNQQITTTIYINDMYKYYQKCNSWEAVLQEALTYMENKALPNFEYPIDISQIKGNIVMQLINTEQNREMLKNIPHRAIRDLSIIYRWLIDGKQDEAMSTIINFPLYDKLGISENELYTLALENTRRILSPTILPMSEVIKKIIMDSGISEESEILGEMLGCLPDYAPMYVISNEKGIWGAVSILFEDILYNLSEKFNSDLYLLPSSIHEVLALSVTGSDLSQLADMVFQINVTEVPLEDRLSNQVYYYDKKLKKLSMAIDAIKRLDETDTEGSGN